MDRLLGVASYSQLTCWRASRTPFSSAPWLSLGLMSTIPPFSAGKFTYFWIMPSPQYPLPWVYTAAGDRSLSSFPEMVMTQYWYTLPTFRSLENTKKTVSYIDTVQGVGWGEMTPIPLSIFCQSFLLLQSHSVIQSSLLSTGVKALFYSGRVTLKCTTMTTSTSCQMTKYITGYFLLVI